MKKLLALVLILICVFGFAACGDGDSDSSSTDIQSIESSDKSLKELALSCVDKSVAELYELVGQPKSSEYAPSCLNPGVGEDGILEYDGFVVYTYRANGEETVYEVE